MTARIVIKDVRTKKDLGVILWNRKGTRRSGYKLSGFTIFSIEKNIKGVEKTTAGKARLLLNTLYRQHKLKTIKTEYDLELAVNMFVHEYNPYLLFNEDKTFNKEVDLDGLITEIKKTYVKNGLYTKYTDRFIKKEHMKKLKEFKKM